VQRIHGLLVASSDPLPGIAAAPDGEPDVVFALADSLDDPGTESTLLYRSAGDDAGDAAVEISRDGQRTCFRYSDGTCIDAHVAARPVRIDATIAPGQTLEDLAAYLYGPVLGLVLRTRGTLALHASCVDTPEGAVLFAGASGAGKSTLAAAFATRSHSILSDDLTALTVCASGLVAHPAFDHLRLWSDSEPLLFGRERVLERITPSWDKRRLSLRDDRFVREPRPVRAVYLLDHVATGGSTGAHSLAPMDALTSLTAFTYSNYLLDASMRATELTQLGALVSAIPVRRLNSRGATPAVLYERVSRDLESEGR
jgi:hypothetical protein